MLRRRFLMAFMSMYRLIRAAVAILVRYEATLNTAPAVEIEVDHQIPANTVDPDATIVAYPAAEIEANKKVPFSLLSRLVAYNRAAGVYIKGILTAHTAGLQAVNGAIARLTKAVKMNITAELQGIESAVAKSKKAVQANVTAAGYYAGAKCATAENECIAEVTAKATTPETVLDLVGDNPVSIGASAPMLTGDAAEVQSKRAIRHSVFARLTDYVRAVATYFTEILTGSNAGLSFGSSVMAGCQETIQSEYNAQILKADSVIVKSRNNRFIADSVAGVCYAHTAETAKAGATFTSEHTGSATMAAVAGVNILTVAEADHAAKIATWIDPVVVDGVLILRQAYSATQENEVLVVM